MPVLRPILSVLTCLRRPGRPAPPHAASPAFSPPGAIYGKTGPGLQARGEPAPGRWN